MDTALTPPSAPSTSTSTAEVKRLVKQVRARATRGNVTTADWRALAEADPARARAELARFLAPYAAADGPNPFAARSRSFGMVIGFLVGLALMVVIWIVMPPLHDLWKDDASGLDGLTTASMLGASLLPLVFAWLGWRRDRASARAGRATAGDDFEDLLRRFERVQRDLRRA